MNRHLQTTMYCLITGSALLLSGCVTQSKMPDLGMISQQEKALDAQQPTAISVEQLLAQARGEQSQQTTQVPSLLLSFMADTTQLSNTQQEQLNRYSNQLIPQTLQVNCAPADAADAITAALTGIARCNSVSQFLTARAHKTIRQLRPSLSGNTVTITPVGINPQGAGS